MSNVQRFKPSLTTGNWPDNPEPLVRDKEGEFVKYEDYLRLQAGMIESSSLIAVLEDSLANTKIAFDYDLDACTAYVDRDSITEAYENSISNIQSHLDRLKSGES